MTYTEGLKALKENGIILSIKRGKLTMTPRQELKGTGYLKGIRLLFKEEPRVRAGFISALRGDQE